MKHRTLTLLIGAVCILAPVSAFATGGDTTFTDIVTLVKGWLGGSLGLLACMLSGVWFIFSLVGGQGFKGALTTLGACVMGHYGPGIIEKIMGAGATGVMNHMTILSIHDVCFLLTLPAATLIAYSFRKTKKEQQALVV
jgi:type IV secretory pathway VirB2 component (pilin)